MPKNTPTNQKKRQSNYAQRFRRRPIQSYGRDAKGRPVERRTPRPLMEQSGTWTSAEVDMPAPTNWRGVS